MTIENKPGDRAYALHYHDGSDVVDIRTVYSSCLSGARTHVSEVMQEAHEEYKDVDTVIVIETDYVFDSRNNDTTISIKQPIKHRRSVTQMYKGFDFS